MSKRGSNHPIPGFYKVQGGLVEDRDTTSMSKQALVREAARLKKRAGGKQALGAAAKRPRKNKVATPAPPAESSSVLARVHDREFAQMNERRQKRPAPARDRQGASTAPPPVAGDGARGLVRRAMHYAMTPWVIARAVVDHFRDRD
jgi:hypothetical protein